jgi:hypothetical protein
LLTANPCVHTSRYNYEITGVNVAYCTFQLIIKFFGYFFWCMCSS